MSVGQDAVQEYSRGARLWQPGAYIGSFGDLATPQIQKYVQNWEASAER